MDANSTAKTCAERDPRKTPKAGDVLRRKRSQRMVLRIQDRWIYWGQVGKVIAQNDAMSFWLAWASKAEVIHAAD